MKTNIALIPKSILSDIKESLNDKFNGNEEKTEVEINNSSVLELFDIYLKWNGIIGHTDHIIAALDGIRKAKGL